MVTGIQDKVPESFLDDPEELSAPHTHSCVVGLLEEWADGG